MLILKSPFLDSAIFDNVGLIPSLPFLGEFWRTVLEDVLSGVNHSDG